jgi:hypothetical protein
VNGPVTAARLGELPGAVEGIDDPHPLHLEAAEVVGPLLGQHGVVGPGGGEEREDALVGLAIPRVPEPGEIGPVVRLAQGHEQASGVGTNLASKEMVVGLARRHGG